MIARAPSILTAEQLAAPGATVGKRYRVFLSYSHTDTTWARWLMRRLEGYRVPARFHGRAAPIGAVGARIAPVFRDRDELPTTSDLGETIRGALRESATLVVICSPTSAKSRWVREEILTFKRLGGSARVFAFIVDGEPKAQGTDEDCFSPALRFELGADGQLSATPAEHVAADARPEGDGKEDAFVRLVAGLLGLGFDELRRREQARRLRRLTWIAVSSVAGMAITLGLALYAMNARNEAVLARNDAQRRQDHSEELIAVMLNDMKAGLQKADKLDALDETGAKLMGYFQTLDPRDLTDTTLAQQAKALTQIGQIRMAQLRYAEASAAFATAFARSAALANRHPGDGGMLFDRAQAEYWVGFVQYKRGELAPAGEWFARYRDSGVSLAGLNPGNQTWQLEKVSGLHNLAVLELERGNLAEARTGFLEELATLEKMAAVAPADSPMKFKIANIESFLGTTAERAGDFPEAIARYGQQVARLEELVQAEPQSARWRRRFGDAVALRVGAMMISGQRSAAGEGRRQALEIFESLAAQDTTNREWQYAVMNARLKEAILLRTDGPGSAAAKIVHECLPTIEQLSKSETSDRAIAGLLATCWRLEAQSSDAASPSIAAHAVAQAMAIGKSLLEQNRASETNLGDYASACVVAGEIARRSGETEAARRRWQEVVELLQTRIEKSRNWRVLDPAARALCFLGRDDEGQALISRLQATGYEPLEAWPDLNHPVFPAPNNLTQSK